MAFIIRIFKNKNKEFMYEDTITLHVSNLYVFRDDLKKVIDKIENSTISNTELNDIWIVMTTFDTTVGELHKLLALYKEHYRVRLELVFNALEFSLARLLELLHSLNWRKINWKNESVLGSIDANLATLDKILEFYANKNLDQRLVLKLKDIKKIRNEIEYQRNVKTQEVSIRKPTLEIIELYN